MQMHSLDHHTGELLVLHLEDFRLRWSEHECETTGVLG